MWVAWHLPIALWTFIRVYGKDEQAAVKRHHGNGEGVLNGNEYALRFGRGCRLT